MAAKKNLSIWNLKIFVESNKMIEQFLPSPIVIYLSILIDFPIANIMAIIDIILISYKLTLFTQE